MQQVTPNSLIEEYVDYAKAVALKAAKKFPIEPEEAIAAGLEGLVQAANKFSLTRYDPERGTLDKNFRSMAYRRIWGAVGDEARKASFTKRRGLEKGIKFGMESVDRMIALEDGSSIPMVELSTEDDLNLDLSYLTVPERHLVLARLAGYTNREIATKMDISPSRVSALMREAAEKVAAHTKG